MKQTLIIILAVIAFAAGMAAAQKTPFQQFPAKVRCATPAPLKLDKPIARDHASKLRAALRTCPNFAGHYTVVDWGCGTECAAYVIINNASGEVYDPPEISRGISLGAGAPEFRPDSTLMVVADCPEPRIYGLKVCKKHFFRWSGSRLLLLRSAPLTTP